MNLSVIQKRSRTPRTRPCLAMLVTILVGSPVWGQVQIPTVQHRTLVVELASVSDKVMLYAGNPAFFLEMSVRPGNIMPSVRFVNPAQAAVLRIWDHTLFENEPPMEDEYIDGELFEEEYSAPEPASQSWEIKLAPASPGKYVLKVTEGEGVFDFTDLAVQEAYIEGDSTKLRIEFDRPNLVEMRRLKITSTGGKLEFFNLLNARPKSATITTIRSECVIEITGKPFEGESEIFFEGVPEKMNFVVSKKIGLHLSGPPGTIARFDRKDMKLDGLAMVTEGYDQKKCRIRMHFSRFIPNLKVEWD